MGIGVRRLCQCAMFKPGQCMMMVLTRRHGRQGMDHNSSNITLGPSFEQYHDERCKTITSRLATFILQDATQCHLMLLVGLDIMALVARVHYIYAWQIKK